MATCKNLSAQTTETKYTHSEYKHVQTTHTYCDGGLRFLPPAEWPLDGCRLGALPSGPLDNIFGIEWSSQDLGRYIPSYHVPTLALSLSLYIYIYIYFFFLFLISCVGGGHEPLAGIQTLKALSQPTTPPKGPRSQKRTTWPQTEQELSKWKKSLYS